MSDMIRYSIFCFLLLIAFLAYCFLGDFEKKVKKTTFEKMAEVQEELEEKTGIYFEAYFYHQCERYYPITFGDEIDQIYMQPESNLLDKSKGIKVK